jgi:ATP-dependent DNA helicase RecG
MKNPDLIKAILEVPIESQNLEFKRLFGNKVVAKIIETIVAMANTDGGIIILGVDDPEKTKLKGEARIFGIEEDATLYDEVIHEIKSITPSFNSIEITELEFTDSKTIVLLYIKKATNEFYSIKENVFVRLYKSNKKLSPQEIVKFSYAKGFEKADRELVEIDFDLLDTSYFDEWKHNRGIRDTDIKTVLYKVGLARKENNILKPTRAAVLLFAEYPTNLMETKCAVRVLQYRGKTEKFGEVPNLLQLPKTIDGPIIDIIRNTQNYVLNLLKGGIQIHSGFVNQYTIPERVIKEAITNAIIHRDYHLKRDIEIRLYEDRIEILSPGLLPYNITNSNIGRVRADGQRNDLLVKHLREFPDPPNLDLNEGIQAMRNEMKKQNLYEPIFLTYPTYQDSVNVVLFNERQPSEWEKVKKYLESNIYITNPIAREITGIVQSHTMSRLFKKWVEKGFLLKINSESNNPKDTKYKLLDSKDL